MYAMRGRGAGRDGVGWGGGARCMCCRERGWEREIGEGGEREGGTGIIISCGGEGWGARSGHGVCCGGEGRGERDEGGQVLCMWCGGEGRGERPGVGGGGAGGEGGTSIVYVLRG